MKGIRTPKGRPPDYCGPGEQPRPCNNHTIAHNIIRDVDLDCAGTVVTFRPATTVKNWSPRFFETMVQPSTPIDLATVGRYACKWHDEWFNVIDLLGNYKNSTEVATALALRSILVSRYLALRNRLYFEKRAKEIPDETREQRMSQIDRDTAARAKSIDEALTKESKHIIRCLEQETPTDIQTDSFVLDGPPSLGGTAVWGARIGHAATCTVVPTRDGHRVHVTYRKNLWNGIQRGASELLSHRAPDSVKRRILSEIVLEHHETMFILNHRWNLLTAEQKESMKSILKMLDTEGTGKRARQGVKPLRLRGNADVPNLFPSN